MREETVTINGVLYNAKTGQPIKKIHPIKQASKPTSRITSKQTAKPAKKVFVRQPKKIVVKSAPKQTKRKPSQSQTLNRQFVRKPILARKVASPTSTQKKSSSKPAPKQAIKKTPVITPPRITYTGLKRPKPTIPAKTSSSVQEPTESKKRNRLITIITSASILLIIAGVVLAYFFVPSFSVFVASSRAGVDATLPVFAPSDYKVSGVAESSPGIVTINYKSSSLNDSYVVTQANSNWDSAGVLENKVKPLGGSYQTLSQKGLTIYRYSIGAIWVNGGILYTITDEGKLSNEQILHIVDGI